MPSKIPQLLDKAWLSERYLANKLSMDEIATELGCCSETVRAALIRFDIPRRTIGEASLIDLTNQKFGKLTVKSFAGTGKDREARWLCSCECGKEKVIRGHCLRSGDSTSCGCRLFELKNLDGFGELRGAFYHHIKRNALKRNLEFEVSSQYLWELFLLQHRKCAFTGRPLTLPKSGQDSSETASLDRIDSNIGYVVGNIQWVHKDINRLKGALKDDVFINIAKEIGDFSDSLGRIQTEIAVWVKSKFPDNDNIVYRESFNEVVKEFNKLQKLIKASSPELIKTSIGQVFIAIIHFCNVYNLSFPEIFKSAQNQIKNK